jgi:methionyl-tRNA formyltransferase
VGVTIDGTDILSGIQGLNQMYNVSEDVALAGQIGFAPSSVILGSNVFIDGIRLAYVNSGTGAGIYRRGNYLGHPIPPFLTIAESPSVTYPSATLGGLVGEVRQPIIDDPNTAPLGVPRLSAAETAEILSLAAARARITRAGIRLPDVAVPLVAIAMTVSVELALGDEVMRDGVRRYDPDLIIAPMLTRAIPADIWSAWPCFIVHPGPMGDRGPSSLDWAIMGGAGRWGVTVLQANAEMDAGDIWSSVEFMLPRCSKSSLYRTEVADAAVKALLLAVARFEEGTYRPEPPDYSRPDVIGARRPPCRQQHRRIDWPAEFTSWVLAKLQAADSTPGVLDVIGDAEYYLFGGHPEDGLRGDPGAIVAKRGGAICRATVDGAVWIPQLRRRPAPGGPSTTGAP